MLSLTENTHRDKSLTGFSIYTCSVRYVLTHSICFCIPRQRRDMSKFLAKGEICQNSSPEARYVKSERDLSHIELARSDNISSLSGWGSPKRRMSFGGSQRSESISSSSFVNIFHESEYIDRRKNKSKNRRNFLLLLLLFLLVIWGWA